MKLKDQVCSFGYSTLLKELGVPQKSHFYWVKFNEQFILVDENGFSGGYFHGTVKAYEHYSAFTVAELGEFLPVRLRIQADDLWLRTSPLKDHAASEQRC